VALASFEHGQRLIGNYRCWDIGEMSPGSRGKSGKLVYVSARVRKSVRERTVAGSGETDGPREGRAGGRTGEGRGRQQESRHEESNRTRVHGQASILRAVLQGHETLHPSVSPPFLPPPWRASVTELSYQRSREPSRYVPKYASRPTNPELGSREREGGRERERARRPRRCFLDRP